MRDPSTPHRSAIYQDGASLSIPEESGASYTETAWPIESIGAVHILDTQKKLFTPYF